MNWTASMSSDVNIANTGGTMVTARKTKGTQVMMHFVVKGSGRSKEEETMKNKDIRTCPFCGGEAKIRKNPHAARVVCSKCGAASETITIQVDICATDEAKRLWNRRVLDDRHERPYDAMGDDQGRGETGDGWYQENFKEAEAYRDNKIPEKLVTNDSIVKNPEAYSR